jgi:hypothetical protein
VGVQYATFLTKFDAHADDGKLAKAKCVGLASDIILEVFGGGGVDERRTGRGRGEVMG